MPNMMAALPNIGAERRKVWLTPTARVPCSNAASIGERKTWTQSKFAYDKIPLKGKNPENVYSVLSVRKPKGETR